MEKNSGMEYEIKPAQNTRIGLDELWAFRELIYFFTWRDVKIKYKQTVLGALWVFIQPFLLMVVFTLFFSRALKVPSGNLPYPIFVYTGLMFWNVFSAGISNAGNSMVTNANIIKKIYFPRLIIPISSVLSPVVDFSVTFLLFIGLLFFYPTDFSIVRLILLMPVSLLITLMATFGLGSLLASLNVKYRDFRYVIPFLLQVLLFLTPVIYPVTIISSSVIRNILSLNPMAGAIDTFRLSLSADAIDYMMILKSLLISAFLFIAGILYFRKTEYYFADLS